MLAFKEQMAKDVENVFFSANEFAESVTYTPKGGVGKTILAIVDIGQEVADNGFGNLPAVIGSALVKASDIASPAPHDEMTISGSLWTVVRIAGGDGPTWALEIATEERVRR